jgi:hypothetical protein
VLLAKASRHLANKEVEAAAAVYKTFERRGPAQRAAAATNLSFLYLLEGDLAAAAKYTDLALKTDRCDGYQLAVSTCWCSAASLTAYKLTNVFNVGYLLHCAPPCRL